MRKVKHGHQVVIHRVHAAQGGGVVIHHGDAGFAAGVLFDFAFHTNPGALVHPADFHPAVLLHLPVDLFLVVRDDVQLALKLAHRAEGAHMGLAVLVGGEEEGAAGLQIFRCFVHGKNSFLKMQVVFFLFTRIIISCRIKKTSTIFMETGIRKERIDGEKELIREVPPCHRAKGFDGQVVDVYPLFAVERAGAVQCAAAADAGGDDAYDTVPAVKDFGGGRADCPERISADPAESGVQLK